MMLADLLLRRFRMACDNMSVVKSIPGKACDTMVTLYERSKSPLQPGRSQTLSMVS